MQSAIGFQKRLGGLGHIAVIVSVGVLSTAGFLQSRSQLFKIRSQSLFHSGSKTLCHLVQALSLVSGLSLQEFRQLLHGVGHIGLIHQHGLGVIIRIVHHGLHTFPESGQEFLQLVISVRHQAAMGELKHQRKQDTVHGSMESHLHAVQQRPYIVRYGIDIIAVEGTQSNGQTDKSTQNPQARHGAGDC